MIFLYSNFLLFMILPLLILGFLIVTNKKKTDRVFSKQMLQKLLIKKSFLGIAGKNILLFASMLLFIIALARPVIPKNEITLEIKKPTFAILLDISASMNATDIFPTRLDFAIKKIKDLIKKSEANISLYAFSDKLYLISPKSSDKDAINFLLEHLDIDSKRQNSSNLFKALNAIKEKNIIIFSDGDITDAMIENIKKLDKDLTLYIICSKNGSAIKVDNKIVLDKDKNIVISKPNPNIKEISDRIFYYSYKDDTKSLLPASHIDSSSLKYQEKKELYIYPLLLASLLLFFTFFNPKNIKRGVFIISLFFILEPSKTYAFGLEFLYIKQAKDAYKNKEYNKAIKLYKKAIQNNPLPELRYDLANSLYKAKRYSEAIKEYKKVLTKDSSLRYKTYYNTANCFVKLKRYKDALNYYNLARSIKSDKKIDKNLAYIKPYLSKEDQKKIILPSIEAKQDRISKKLKIKTFMIPLTKKDESEDAISW